ncbi:sensor histidine kinase [Thermomonospora amylolytica]|uniref:sensor histidine kinase n=1 Tax=Thermomonospora amylolytica TaxID=1411117 RepID=UPI000E6CAA08|nr:sensor histidine kinase [Thermomonospora amylolytica]
MLVRLRRLRLATRIFLAQVAVIGLVLVMGTALALRQAHVEGRDQARQRVVDIALTLSASPEVAAALTGPDPARRLQPLAEDVRRATGVDWVVVMGPDRVRYSHPDPRQIGRTFLGHVDEALRGRVLTETYTGTLGPSLRAVVPVFSRGRVVGMVGIGITTIRVGEELRRRVPGIVLVALAGFGAAAVGALLVSRRLRRQTLGLEPAEITRMYEHHDAVLHSVREGVVVFDSRRRPVLVNDEAVRLLGLPSPAAELPEALRELLDGRPAVTDEVYLADDRILVVNQLPAVRDGRTLGAVATLRDHTELEALSGELNSVRGLAEALRAQAHEAANKLHTVITMVELGRAEEAVAFATAELATAQELTDRLLAAVDEPVLSALLLGKAAQAAQHGVELTVTDDTAVTAETGLRPRDLVTLVGNLVDNAIEAAQSAPPPRRVHVTVRQEDTALVVRVADTGTGLDPDRLAEAFTPGWSTKPAERPQGRGIGLGLVRQVIRRYDGDIEVTRDQGAVVTVRLPLREAAVR